MDAYRAINDTLVKLVNEIWTHEGKAIVSGEFKDITNNDFHVIEAIGLGDGNNMSTVAKKIDVTVGTLTSAMNSLVKKKYVVRERSEEDRRVVNVKLTEKGEKAFAHHAEYHRLMTEAVITKLSEDEIPVCMKMLDGLSGFFRDYSEQYRNAADAEEHE